MQKLAMKQCWLKYKKIKAENNSTALNEHSLEIQPLCRWIETR